MALIPSSELRTQLRELIDEVIPIPGTPADTRFSDSQVDTLLSVARHIHEAAVIGWRSKAARAMSERDGLEESQAGDEKHKFVSIEKYRDHCLIMAKMYADLMPSTGSRAMGYCLPPVFTGVSQ